MRTKAAIVWLCCSRFRLDRVQGLWGLGFLGLKVYRAYRFQGVFTKPLHPCGSCGYGENLLARTLFWSLEGSSSTPCSALPLRQTRKLDQASFIPLGPLSQDFRHASETQRATQLLVCQVID